MFDCIILYHTSGKQPERRHYFFTSEHVFRQSYEILQFFLLNNIKLCLYDSDKRFRNGHTAPPIFVTV